MNRGSGPTHPGPTHPGPSHPPTDPGPKFATQPGGDDGMNPQPKPKPQTVSSGVLGLVAVVTR